MIYVKHGKIGGTAATIIAKGDHFGNTPFTLWNELTGRRPPEDLSWKLPVQIGIATEGLNRRFFAYKTGRTVKQIDDVIESSERPHCVAQVDGVVLDQFTDEHEGVWEGKHTNDRQTVETQMEAYYPQAQHYMYVLELKKTWLSCIFGNSRHAYGIIDRDDDYIEKLENRVDEFWWCVENGVPPKDEKISAVPIEVDIAKITKMDGNNRWADAASDWLETREAATIFKSASDSLKEIAPKDAKITEGHGVRVTRDAKGKARITDM